ncbi:hypothetical protein [Methylobacterium nonmethylotrophicum]|uniref:Restriction system protein Mrr-like N-terminal domain-containing protein n=1 Tax=Methylobacterium nonmethylotrophicum TaxID=1141884 RepID=A0A4Z0NMU7_9HYPH|nr:hypothetical protein [Methylobacterium nonmethylotrophicum]TGD97975.1 hypothetical protein EU555_17600 [Methylobacterium nonmethylotrophicum]
MTREDLVPIVEAAVHHYGGKANLIQVAKFIWDNHEGSLRSAGDFFYKWQYEARWAANELRQQGVLKPTTISGRGILELA